MPRSALSSLGVALALAASSAQARIPAKETETDGGIRIKNVDVYRLPKERPLYHGTSDPFRSFIPHKDDEHGKVGTWFGANLETAAAQAYKYWCALKGPAQPGPAVLVTRHVELNLLLVPLGGSPLDAHKGAAAKIGLTSENMNGVPSFKATALLDAICKTTVYVKDNKIQAWSRGGDTCKAGTGLPSHPCQRVDGAGMGERLELHGWRAPWDQNEIAICHDLSTAPFLEVASTVRLPKPAVITATSRSCAGTNYETESALEPPQKTYDYVFKKAGAWKAIATSLWTGPKPVTVKFASNFSKTYKATVAAPLLTPDEFSDWVKSTLPRTGWEDQKKVSKWAVIHEGKNVDGDTWHKLQNNAVLYIGPLR